MSVLRILLLGPPVIEQSGDPVHLSRRKALALLAYLAVHPENHRRDSLAALLWPDLDRKRALASLRRILLTATKALPVSFLEADRNTVGLKDDPELLIDTRLLATAAKIAEQHSSLDGSQKQLLESAAELYRGDFLAGFTLKDSAEFDEWQYLQSEATRRQMSLVLNALIRHFRNDGNFKRAISTAHRRLSLDRLAEDVHRLLIELYLQAGERTEALRQFDRCTQILKEELGVDPEPATHALAQKIRSGDPVTRARREETASTAQQQVPLASEPICRNFPETRTTFVGRRAEIDRVTKNLHKSRLLTLLGPGGMGKTRLAIEAGRVAAADFSHGCVFVPLADASPALVLSTLIESLGVPVDPTGEAEAQLLNYLSRRELLLVMDNFEHVVERADLMSRILSQTSGISILVTSRERLNLQGENLMEIGGLDLPATEEGELESYSAIELFLEAARRADSGFRLDSENRPAVIRICSLLEGMPLGIELAAGWLRVLPCADIADEIANNMAFLSSRLRDLPERHRSLRAVYESSLTLVSQDDRDALMRLSQFRGDFSREAAERVADASLPGLLSLVDKSLVARSGRQRFRLHELIRQFSAERLSMRPEEAEGVRDRHSQFFLELLQIRSSDFHGALRTTAFAEILREIDNIRAAWAWAVERRQTELLGKALDPLYQFFLMSNWYEEGLEMMEAAQTALSRVEQPLLWALASARHGRFCNRLARYSQASLLLKESLEIFRELEVPEEIAFTLSASSVVNFHLGEFGQAKSLAEESVQLWREIGKPVGIATALVHLGRIAGIVGEYERAREILEEAFQGFQNLKDESGMARCLTNMGNVASLSGQIRKSIEIYNRSLAMFSNVADRRGMALCHCNLGLVLLRQGEPQEAKDKILRGLELYAELGHQGKASVVENLGRACFALGEFDESRNLFIQTLVTAQERRTIPIALMGLAGIARLAAHEGDLEEAWKLASFVRKHPNLMDEGKLEITDLMDQIRPRIDDERRIQIDEETEWLQLEEVLESVLEQSVPGTDRALPSSPS